jgi:hypothetical protein
MAMSEQVSLSILRVSWVAPDNRSISWAANSSSAKRDSNLTTSGSVDLRTAIDQVSRNLKKIAADPVSRNLGLHKKQPQGATIVPDRQKSLSIWPDKILRCG